MLYLAKEITTSKIVKQNTVFLLWKGQKPERKEAFPLGNEEIP